MKFKVIAAVELEVEADNFSAAALAVSENPVPIDTCGVNVDIGRYSIKSTGKQQVQSIERKEN